MAQPPAPAAPAFDAQAAIDDALWETVKESRSSAEVFAYLNRFPAGRHAREARIRLLDLAQPGAGGAGTPVPAAGATLGAPSRTAMPGSPAAPLRFSAEQIASWAPAGGEPRPATPRRNAAGFAEGDRFEYEMTDRSGGGGVTRYVWQVDGIEEGGALSINGGRQRLDALGQLQRGTDEHSGWWTELSTPVPLHELARRGAGVTMPFSTIARVHSAGSLREEVSLSGELRTSLDTVIGLHGTSGPLPCIKIELEIDGVGRGSGVSGIFGTAFQRLRWRHTYWMAPPLLLPVAFEVNDFDGRGRPRQQTRHVLIGIDQLSLTEAATATAGSRR